MFRVLFVCTGGTCRSPMADCIFRQKLENCGIRSIESFHRGLFVDNNSSVENKALFALKLMNIKTKPGKPIQLTQQDIETADLVLTITTVQKKAIEKNFGKQKKVFSLAEFTHGVDILDPFGHSEEIYVRVSKQLDFSMQELLEILIKGEGYEKNNRN